MDRIEQIRKKLESIEERDERARKEIEQAEKWTFRQRVERMNEKERFKTDLEEAFNKYVKKNYPERREEAKALFPEYWELQLDEKVENMKEYLKSKYGSGAENGKVQD